METYLCQGHAGLSLAEHLNTQFSATNFTVNTIKTD